MRRRIEIVTAATSALVIAALLVAAVSEALEGQMLLSLLAVHGGAAIALLWVMADRGLSALGGGSSGGSTAS